MTEEDIMNAVRDAAGPLYVRGGGTRSAGAPGAQVLDVSGHCGITLHEPGALTLVAKAGTPLAEIEEALRSHNQRLAFEPYDLTGMLGTSGASTIGGIMATNASGPRRIQAGAARDFALGVRFVDGRGDVIKNGGRVMKNVTGYDLVKLMCGSRGSLGVLTEISLKVLPDVEATQTLMIEGIAPKEAVAAMSRALGSPYDVSGAAWSDEAVWLRIEGFADSVAYRADKLTEMLAPFGPVVQAPDADWTTIRDATPLHGAEAVWRISVKPSDGPAVIAALPDTCNSLMDWGGGLVWVGQTGGDIAATHHMLQARAAQLGGHATRIKGPATLPALQPDPPAVATLVSALRAQFDPRGLFHSDMLSA